MSDENSNLDPAEAAPNTTETTETAGQETVPSTPVATSQEAGTPEAGTQEAVKQEAESTSAESPAKPVEEAQPKPASGGPINLARIRELRKSQQKAAPVRPAPIPTDSAQKSRKPKKSEKPAPQIEEGVIKTPDPPGVAPRVEVPSTRQPLSQELEDEISAALGDANLDNMLVGDAMLQVGRMLDDGQRMQGKVMKAQGEFVFVSLGGPNEGLVPVTQFEEAPEAGTQIEVIVRSFLPQEGLYELTMPGNAIEVDDWSDLSEGEVVEALVTGANSGGLECKVGAIRGFIPASQAAEYRIENLADLVDQKLLCVVTEANPRRGNLVLSHRAVLEREKQEKREERLEALEVGSAVDGTVTKLMDFGAFVDIGGLDGLLHISQLSWERVEHPREILEEGQKIQVRIDKIDKQSGKIGLSYRSLQEHPWADIDGRFPVGSMVKGTVTRIAEFGAFVKVATGVEGLVHLSELAHHRVHRVTNVVNEGQEVEVKVLSVDSDSQRMSLSLKAAQAAPEGATDTSEAKEEQPPAKPVLPKHQGPLKGGTGSDSGGEQFGLKW